MLRGRQIVLLLPVYDLESKASAVATLRTFGLSEEAMEQKCLKQIWNRPLSPDTLAVEVDRWEASTLAEIKRLEPGHVRILDHRRFSASSILTACY
jgi:hypothetical protein